MKREDRNGRSAVCWWTTVGEPSAGETSTKKSYDSFFPPKNSSFTRVLSFQKADPTQFLQIHGRQCKIHLDPSIAAAADSASAM
jgi:hypothetical protein